MKPAAPPPLRQTGRLAALAELELQVTAIGGLEAAAVALGRDYGGLRSIVNFGNPVELRRLAAAIRTARSPGLPPGERGRNRF